MAFPEFYKHYPHCKRPRRSVKAICEAMYKQITTDGRTTTVQGLTLRIKCTEAEMDAAAKAYADEVLGDYEVPYHEATKYVPGCQVWMNQGRMFDHIEIKIEEEENVTHLRRRG